MITYLEICTLLPMRVVPEAGRPVPVSASDLSLLRCPTTGGRVVRGENGTLASEDGSFTYPVVADVPILINEQRSSVSVADYVRPPAPPRDRRSRPVVDAFDSILPSLSQNVGSRGNYERLANLLQDKAPARVLVVGGAIAGVGFDALLVAPNIELVEADIAWGPRTTIICDAHDLPFQDGTFDAVVCQAVLEHVLDPARVVDEIHRVLTQDGLLYSEVPFMYQVHGAPYDFTRFTPLGHRRLYRYFDEIDSGIQCGPGSALALSLTYFLRSLPRSTNGIAIAMRIGRVLFFWLKHLDRWLIARPAAIDAAAGTFFLGRRRTEPLADERMIASYRGLRAS